jgi:hypothetical protein
VGQIVKELSLESMYSIDSFPVSVCQNIRIPRCRIVKGKEYKGFNASKRSYFYGFKVHIIVNSKGIPVEFTFTTANAHDLDGLRQMPVNLLDESSLMADSAYTDYVIEEMFEDNNMKPLQDKTAYNHLHINILISFCIEKKCIFAICFTKRIFKWAFMTVTWKNGLEKTRSSSKSTC